MFASAQRPIKLTIKLYLISKIVLKLNFRRTEPKEAKCNLQEKIKSPFKSEILKKKRNLGRQRCGI